MTGSASSPLYRLVRRSELYLGGVIVVVGIVIAALNPGFLSPSNLLNLLATNTFFGILALGEVVVLISGGIDVSFTAVATVAQYVMGVMLASGLVKSVFVAFLIPIPIGVALGAINALIIRASRVHPVIVTIATLNVFYGILIFVTGGTWIYSFPPGFMSFSTAQLFSAVDPQGAPYGLSVFVLFWAGAAVLTWLILRHLAVGRKVYAVGGSLEGARRIGISILGVQLFVYCYMGALAGIASFVSAEMNQIVQPNAIVGQELFVLAAAIIGGASVFGGSGSVLGGVLGVLLIGVITNGLILMKVPSYWHQVVMGLIIVVAAALNAYQRYRRERRRGVVVAH